MRGKRYTAEQIVGKLREAEAMLSAGKTMAQVIQTLGIGHWTYYRWRRQYANLSVPEARKLKALEQENARLKRLVAEQALDLSMLREVAQGKW